MSRLVPQDSGRRIRSTKAPSVSDKHQISSSSRRTKSVILGSASPVLPKISGISGSRSTTSSDNPMRRMQSVGSNKMTSATTAQLKPLPKTTSIVASNTPERQHTSSKRMCGDRARSSSKASSKTELSHESESIVSTLSIDFGTGSTPLVEPSIMFMAFLNENAIKIQKWYRRRRQAAQARLNHLSPRNIDPDSAIHLKVSGDIQENVDDVIMRRKRMAEAAREEIMREMQRSQAPIMAQTTIIEAVAPSAEPEVLKPIDHQNKITDPLHIQSNVQSAESVDNVGYEYDYEDDFEPITIESPIEGTLIDLDAVLKNETSGQKEVPVAEKRVKETSVHDSSEHNVVQVARSTRSNAPIPTTPKPNETDLVIAQSRPLSRDEASYKMSLSDILASPRRSDYRFDIGKIPNMANCVNDVSFSATPVPRSVPKVMSEDDVRSSTETVDERRANTQSNHCRVTETAPSTNGYISVSQTISTGAVHQDSTSRRVDRILEFLKTVEEEDRQVIKAPVVAKPNPIDMMAELFRDSQGNGKAAGANLEPTTVFEGVKTKIMSQQLEIEEKTRTLDLIKKELKKLKDMNKEQSIEHQKSLKSQLALQRKEYETIVKRHLAFIDKLLAEKEDLSKRCEQLTNEVKQLEKQFLDKSKALEEQHARDIKQQREMWLAAEKIKRDKWIQEKTKSIKDQTVKGLEPEIQRMIAQHKAQIRDLEEKFREQVAKEKSLLAEQHQRQLDTIRDRAVADRQKACEEEREFARQRYIKQLERDEMEFQQQKRKLMAEFDEQKHNLVESFKEERKMDDHSHRKAIEDMRKQMESDREARDQALDELRKKHLVEMQSLREKLQIEKEEWQSHYMKKVENEVRSKEKLFKEKLIKERDAEIQMVIQRLESESTSTTSDVTRKHRMDIERIKAETAEEIKHLRDQHSMALDKVLSGQTAINQLEDHRRQLQKEALQAQHEIAAKDATIRQQKAELGRLKVDEQTLINTIRREFNEQLDAKESAIQSLTDEINMLHDQIEVLRRRYQQDLETYAQDKESSMAQIEDRVKQTLKQKDDIISSLRSQHDDMVIRNRQLEALIEKQRQARLICLQSDDVSDDGANRMCRSCCLERFGHNSDSSTLNYHQTTF